MFDISFSELLVIGVVALIVIGPEKLPKVARTVGALVGRMQRYVATVKEEVNRETRFAELQQLQEEIQRGVESTKASIVQTVQGLEQDIEQQVGSVKQAVTGKPLKELQLETNKANDEVSSAPSESISKNL